MKKNRSVSCKIYLGILALCIPTMLWSQINISSLAEYQVGNMPDASPENLTTLYNNLDLFYQQNNVVASFKFERFQHPDFQKEYGRFTQKALTFSLDPLEVTFGNFTEIFGSGLLLRSFEISGNILEDQLYRTRYGFYRDIDGMLAKYQTDNFELKVLRGRPLFNALPPTADQETRRPVLVEGLEAAVTIFDDFTIGQVYLRENSSTGSKEYGSLNLGANLSENLQVYSEYAQLFEGTKNLFSFSDKSSHAFYAGGNYTIGPLGLSFEAKDYKNFLLNFNDPPPIVREHQYLVLNRSTHLLEPLDETGWQGELIWGAKNGDQLTISFAHATNQLLGKDADFEELFAEVALRYGKNTSGKFFFDYSIDEFNFERDRIALGTQLSRKWSNRWSSAFSLEYQRFTRNLGLLQNVKNAAATLSVTRAPDLSVGIVWEMTNEADRERLTADQAEPNTFSKNWLAFTAGYQVNRNHFISLFYGTRRGGPACTSGICYDVLDFEGFEMRLSTNL